MSRLKNFSRNLAASYLQLVTNVAYSLLSVPIILHWLPGAEFGLWAVLMQLTAYFFLIDMGINQAIARFLVDHKDQRENNEYGALVLTSLLVSLAQAGILLLLVFLGAPLLASLMKIEPKYFGTFTDLLRWQGLIMTVTFCTNPLSIMLNSHQRMDLVSRQSVYNMIFSFGLLVAFLAAGKGIYSFIYANAIVAPVTPICLAFHCHRLGFMPKRQEWGGFTWIRFWTVFNYGKDLFLINLGAYLITASQIIIVTRTLGLEAAAAWSVGTKVYMLVRQIIYQPYSAAIPGLSEMAARQEQGRLRGRFKNLVVLTASLGVFTGVAFALCNSLFVGIWTHGKIEWSPLNDLLLAIWLILSALQCTHCNFVAVTKRVCGMRYLYFVEGCCFVALALGIGYKGGMPGIIACSIVCTLLFSYPYGLRLSRQYFHLHYKELGWQWVRPTYKLLAILVPLSVLLWLGTSPLPSFWRLAIHAVTVAVVGGLFFLRIGLPTETVREVGGRLPRQAARFLEMLLPCRI